MEPDKIDDMIKKYIYESPDGGNTVTKREFGSNKKEYVKSLADKKEIEKLAEEFEQITGSDVGYDMSRDWLDHGKTYTIDTSTLATSGTTLTTSRRQLIALIHQMILMYHLYTEMLTKT